MKEELIINTPLVDVIIRRYCRYLRFAKLWRRRSSTNEGKKFILVPLVSRDVMSHRLREE